MVVICFAELICSLINLFISSEIHDNLTLVTFLLVSPDTKPFLKMVSYLVEPLELNLGFLCHIQNLLWKVDW